MPLPGLCVPPHHGGTPHLTQGPRKKAQPSALGYAGAPFPAGEPQAARGLWLWLSAQQAGGGPKADGCHQGIHSPGLHSCGSGEGAACVPSSLSSLVSVRTSRSLGRAAGHGEASSGGRLVGASMSPTQGGLCPRSGGSGLIGVAWARGQQGRCSGCLLEGLFRVCGGWGWGPSAWAGLCLFSPWRTGASKKVPGQVKGSASLGHPARFFPRRPLPTLASQRGPHSPHLGTILWVFSPCPKALDALAVTGVKTRGEENQPHLQGLLNAWSPP